MTEHQNAWQENANQLGRLTFERFAVRTDACGLYVKNNVPPFDYSPGPNNTTAKLHSSEDLRGKLNRHFRGIQTAGLHSQTADSRCRWFGIDLDCKEWYPEREERAARNLAYAQTLQDRLRERGFFTLLEDSNGIGGYHVLGRFDELVPQAWLYHFLQSEIIHDAEDCGFGTFVDADGKKQSDLPETFPKQASCEGKFGNWLRLPGRHHRLTDHWSQFIVDGEILSIADSVQAWIDFPASDHRLIPEFIAPTIQKPAPKKITATSTGVKGCRESAQDHVESMPWSELLKAFHWQDCGGAMWRRPGKPAGGHSAQLNDVGLHVYSEAVADLEAGETYGKWRFYVCSSGFSMDGTGQIEAARHLFGQEQADAIDKEAQRAFAKQKQADSVVPFFEGDRVRCGDRGNFGTVVQDDGGPMVSVHFVAKDGNECTKEIPRAEVKNLDGTPASGEPRTFNGKAAAELWDLADQPVQWLVEGVFSCDQPTIFGAKQKSLKTTLLSDLAVCLPTGFPWLGKFNVPEKRRTLFVTGEASEAAAIRKIKRAAESRNLRREDFIDSLRIEALTFPTLPSDKDCAAVAEAVKEHGIEVVLLDPLYMGLQGLNTANLTEVGPAMRQFMASCRPANVIIAHHVKKTASFDDAPNLEDLSQAGIAEFAGNYWLMGRMSEYTGDGMHSLAIRYGGRDEQFGLLKLDFDERDWKAEFTSLIDHREDQKQRRENERVGAQMQAVKGHLSRNNGQATLRALAEAAATKPNRDSFQRLIDELCESGQYERFETKGGNNKVCEALRVKGQKSTDTVL